MPTFKLDGKEIPFEPGDTIIKAAWRQGIEIPHYCWHPGLSVAANCRMCLVEILPAANQRAMMLDILEWDAALNDYRPVKKPKLQPSCQYAATEGMEVNSDTSAHVVDARKAVQEFLLLNHPVDCPICDQSGECKLQDYWLDHGQYKKRMRDEPVHKPKAVQFGPTIVYDAERCVMCTRCVRFMDEVAQDPVLDMRERGNLNEISVAPGRELDGHYTFMTEHVCPVGALTTKDFRFKARVWFLRTVNSVCQGCATGCNAHLDFDPRYDKVQRYRPRDNEAVNKFWMCDEGMLSYHRAHEGRITEPKVAGKTVLTAVALEEARRVVASIAKESIAIVLSAQHSLEDNWALREFGVGLMGATSLYVTGATTDGYEDKILIHRDKNPNTSGVKLLAPEAKPFSALTDDIAAGRVTHVIALGGETPGGLSDVETLSRVGALIVIASHDGPLVKAARVVLPAASWAEASGTYVNAKSMAQVADKAIEPQGSSKAGWQQVAALASALGFEMPLKKLKEVRAQLPAPAPAPAPTVSGVVVANP
jgi:NADH-quinone oxidoreductase subunit G